MNVSLQSLQAALDPLVGGSVRVADDADTVAGVRPQLVVEPGNEEQVSAVLAFANREGLKVLVRGGGKAPDKEILERTEALIKQGAAGIVYGRNIIQHGDPAGMTRALMAIVHEGASAKQAAKLIKA